MRITLARSKTIPSYIMLDGYRISQFFERELESIREKYSTLIGQLLSKRRQLTLPQQNNEYHEIGRQMLELNKQYEQEIMELSQMKEGV